MINPNSLKKNPKIVKLYLMSIIVTTASIQLQPMINYEDIVTKIDNKHNFIILHVNIRSIHANIVGLQEQTVNSRTFQS